MNPATATVIASFAALVGVLFGPVVAYRVGRKAAKENASTEYTRALLEAQLQYAGQLEKYAKGQEERAKNVEERLEKCHVETNELTRKLSHASQRIERLEGRLSRYENKGNPR